MNCYICKHSKEYYGLIKRADGKKEMYCNKKDFFIGTVEESKTFVYWTCYEKDNNVKE